MCDRIQLNMPRLIVSLTVCLVICIELLSHQRVLGAEPEHAPAQAAAPMWGIDFANSWQSPFAFPTNRPQIVWEQAVGFTNAFPTAITLDSSDGLFIPGTSEPFRRLLDTGDADLSAPLTVSRSSTTAHSVSGQSYLWRGGLFEARSSSNGDLLWSGVPSNVSDGLPPKIGNDGSVYAPEISGQLFKYAPNGQLIYASEEYGSTGILTGMVPVVDMDANAYFATGSRVISLDSDGNERWNVVASTNFTPLIMAPDGNLYHTGSREIVGRDADTGDVVSQIPDLGRLEAISSDGVLYTLNPFEGIRAIHLDGSELWQYERQFLSFQSLTVDSAGKVLASDELGNLIALSSEGNLLWELELADNAFPIPHPPTVLPDGRIVVHQRSSAFLLAVPEPNGTAMLAACTFAFFSMWRRQSRRKMTAVSHHRSPLQIRLVDAYEIG